VLNAGYDQQSGEAAIREGRADTISFGSLFIANPDLPVRRLNHDSGKIQSLTRRLRVTKNVLLCLRREFARVLEN
jgi:2,4-dienoyl-CoA reductase-like NADH-dependent reductase (Old Yellow Enzyme family)